MNRQNNKNYAQAAAQSKTNNNTHHQNQQHHHQQAPQQNQTSGTSTSSNFSSSANGKTINKSQMKPQAQHNSTMGNGNTGRSTPIKKNPVQLPANGHSWEKRTSTSIEFGSINTPNAQISSLPTSTGPTLTSGGGIPSTLPTKGVPTFGTLSNTTTPNIQAAQTTPTTIGTSGPGANNNNNNSNSNNNNNNNGVAPKPISARAGEIPRTHSAPPQFQDNRNVRQSGHLTNVPCTNNIHQQQSAAVSHQQSSASVSNPPINHRKDSVSSTVSSNDGQSPFHPHHSPHHPSHTHNHHYPRQHHNHKPNMVPPNQYRPRDNKNVTHPSQHLNPAQSVQAQGVMPMTGPQLWNYPRVNVNEYPIQFYPYNPSMYIPQYAMPRPPPQMQTHLSQVPSVAFKPPSTTTTKQSKAIEIIDPSKGAPIQFKTQPQSKSPLKREESPPAVFDKKPEESDKEKSSSAVPIIDPAEKDKEARERKEREEQDRIAKEKFEQERKEKEEKERKEREEQERIAKEKEEQERMAKEKEEQERRERVEREERERKEREERERKEREEREERERKEREERERKEREERERKEREERERKEREERERKEREERERKEREEQERLEAERKEKEEKERKEREEREKREREEREERERIAKEEQERKEREEKERLEKERLEAERIEKEEKERKEAEEKARKEQEEKKEKEEVERKKKEEEEAKAKAAAEGEKKKEKEAESNDSKKEEKKYGKGNRPGPLDLSRTTSAPAIPSAPLSALGSARKIDDINSVQYPEGISSPNPALNANSEPGKFKYDRSFLMQFMGVCKEKPENLPALEAIGMDEPKDDRKKTRPSTSRSNSLHKNTQFTNMGEFKITPKTSEERFAQSNLRNGASSSLFGRAPLGRTGSGSTLLPTPAMSATPQSPSRTSSGRGTPRKGGKGSHQMQGNMGEHIAPLERSENRWVPGSEIKSDSLELESIRRKVKALLNKLTLEKFDSISDQIIEYANKSRDERDGRILREVIRLIFEKSCDESNFCAMYAQLCRKMMERVDPEIVDENVKNTEGKFVQGGTLFRKYLLNRCQEDFEKGWKVNIPVPSNEKGEPDLMSDEYYVAAKAKRQGLGLIRFIGELFKLNMLTERIMHECIKKLLIFQGSPEEEEMESLCKLMNTVGEQLDHVKTNQHEQIKANQIDHAKAKQLMENYFNRMEEISKLPNLSSRIKFMIMDVIDLRSNAWKPRRDINAPKTIAEIHEDAAKQKEEAEFLRRTASSGGKLPKISEQMSRSGSGRRDHKGMTSHGSPGNDGWINVGTSQRKDKVGDLTKFGSVNRGKITNFSLAPGGLPLSGGAKGWKSDSKVDDHKTTVLSRTNSLNTYSLLESSSSEGRKSSELSTSEAPKPSPSTERKKLNLAPRTKPIAEESQTADKSASKSNSEMVSLAQPMSEELAVKKINNMMEEYFSVLDIQEVIHCLKEIPESYHARTIELFASKVIEQKQKDVDNVTKLFKEIVSSGTCDVDTFKNGFSSTLAFLMDIGADAPKSYSFTGQLLFSAGLDFRDISKLLVPLDDDKSVEKIVKGYASALKNDVDEQKYVQKINEFDFKLLFPKKNKDDINKYLEDLGLGSSKK